MSLATNEALACFLEDLVVNSILFHEMQNKKGKNEDTRRKVNVMLLSGQRLELTCDTKTVCKDVFDMVVAHIGLVEHHLFGLATLKGKASLTMGEFIC